MNGSNGSVVTSFPRCVEDFADYLRATTNGAYSHGIGVLIPLDARGYSVICMQVTVSTENSQTIPSILSFYRITSIFAMISRSAMVGIILGLFAYLLSRIVQSFSMDERCQRLLDRVSRLSEPFQGLLV